jgi:outer membrane lipoprotein-sorting protein
MTHPFDTPSRAWRHFSIARTFSTALLLAAFVSPALAGWDLQQLMQSLAQNKSAQATFTERKYIALLESPVESSGELLYTAPARLEKRTLKPRPESLLVSDGELIVERGKQKHRIQLQDHPEIAAFIESIRGTLAGDQNALEKNYRVTLKGTRELWTLELRPLKDKGRSMVRQVRMTGSAGELQSVEVTQTDGDSSVMTLQKQATP